MASGLRQIMRAARYLKPGDHVHVPTESGLGMTHAVLKEKRPARRHFSRGTAYDLMVENDNAIHTHPLDAGKTWRVYALGEDKFEVALKAGSRLPPREVSVFDVPATGKPSLPPGTSRG
jgi:hypothetical protein